MFFIPISPVAVKAYVDRMTEGISHAGRPLARSVTASREIADRMSGKALQEADINFWKVIKAAIEYVIDFANQITDRIDVNDAALHKAYLDLHRLIDWVGIVYGEEWEPELAVDD